VFLLAGFPDRNLSPVSVGFDQAARQELFTAALPILAGEEEALKKRPTFGLSFSGKAGTVSFGTEHTVIWSARFAGLYTSQMH
jgi:hypothetical protein